MKKTILLSVTILWMILIFVFSAQPADESAELSNSAGAFVCRLFIPGFQELSPWEQMQHIEGIDHTIRKIAHGTEYFVLGILCAATLLSWVKKSRKLLLCSGFLIAVLYSVTDEIHQIFVPGRACMFTDILIDSAGALAGVLVFSLLLLIRRTKNRSVS